MNPFLMSSSQRMTEWKNFRHTLKSLSDTEQLKAVTEFWAQAPLMTIAHDPEELDCYPGPWEMMEQNDWCGNSIAVGMEFTLRLAGWDANRLRIIMLKDYDISEQKLVVEVDGKYLLNYEYGAVAELPNTDHERLTVWKFSGRKYEQE